MTDTHPDTGKPRGSDSTSDSARSGSNSGPRDIRLSAPADSGQHVSDVISVARPFIMERLSSWPGLKDNSITELVRHGSQFLDCLVEASGDSWLAVTAVMFESFHDGGFVHPTTGRMLSTARGSRAVRRWGAVRVVLAARERGVLAPDSGLVRYVDPPVVRDPIMELPEYHPDRIHATVMRYRPRPKSADEAEKLPAFLETMREWVLAAEPPTAPSATSWLRIVADALLWAERRLGTTDPRFVLHPTNVEACVLDPKHDWTPYWRSQSRSTLNRIGRAICPDLQIEKPQSIRSNCAPEPYSATDEFLFREAALIEGKKSRRERLWLTAAPLGAGLGIAEASRLGPKNLVDLDGGRLGIRTHGDQERIVPVRDPYTALVVEAARLCEGPLFVPADAKARPYNLFAKVRVAGLGRLIVSRARATWMCAHIHHGTTLRDLYRIAGPVTGDYLTQMLRQCVGSVDALDAANRGLGP